MGSRCMPPDRHNDVRDGARMIAKTRRVIGCAVAIALASAVHVAAQPDDQTVFYQQDGLTLQWHVQAGLYLAFENDVFWDLAATTAPGTNFDADKRWQETYIKPGLSFQLALDDDATVFGKISAVASYTFGTDPFDEGDNGAVTLEEAYLGVRGVLDGDFGYEFSLGARELKLGTGMLIANGATSGFERGTLKFGPRKAWERSLIGRLTGQGAALTAFYLDPNELSSTDGENELIGVDLRYDATAGGFIGGTFVHALNSQTPYPQAALGGFGTPVITTGARDGTNTLGGYARTGRFGGVLQNLTLTADVAYQWNDRIDLRAWAGRVQAIYAFPDLPFTPTLTVGYQTFSGDDPRTTALERFDPLYFEGSPTAWATGTKSASTLINSNVNALVAAIQLKPSAQDTLTFRYAHIRANELRSPVQFGQATRLDITGPTSNVVSGVTDAHLADDFFIEYNRIITRNIFFTAGLAISLPGQGIKDVSGGSAPNWPGGFMNIVVNF